MRGVKAAPKTRPAAKQIAGKGSAAAKKPAARPLAAAKQPAARPLAAAKQPAAKPSRPLAPRKPAPRADLGAAIDGFFGRQSPQLRPILEALRAMIEQAVPDARSSIKWGMPFFTLDGEMLCALGSHKSHVNLILAGPPGAFDDPDGLLEGTGTTGRHLKLTRLDELPRAAVRGWLRTAAEQARARG